MRMRQGVRTGLGHGGITCVLQTQFSRFFFFFFFFFLHSLNTFDYAIACTKHFSNFEDVNVVVCFFLHLKEAIYALSPMIAFNRPLFS